MSAAGINPEFQPTALIPAGLQIVSATTKLCRRCNKVLSCRGWGWIGMELAGPGNPSLL